jgi:hypothetical protein
MGNTRSASSFEVSCFNDSECSPEILTTVKNHTYDAYNHWLDIMNLQLNEYPKIIKVIIQSIYTGNCLENAGIKGQYVYKDEFIYICIKKLTPLRPWEFRSSETVKETIFHEMFHGVQYGIASSVQTSPKDLIKFHYSTKWIIEATAAAAANSGTNWNTSNEWANKSVNTAFYAKSGSLADVGKYYRVHDYWIHSLPSILATKNLFKVNKNRTYTKDDLDYNVQLVTELLGKTDPNYIRDTYWKWVKSQALELNKDFLEEGNPCSIFRKETENEISSNSVDIDFDATFLKKDATAIAKIPKTLPATPLTSRLWNFTFTNVPGKRYIRFKLSSTQPNAKFHIYKLPKDLPAGYTACQDPQGSKDYTDNFPANSPDPRDFEVDNETRIVVLGSNLEYVNPADLTLEMGILKPKIALSTNSISLNYDENNGAQWTGDFLKIANIGDVNSVLEYQMYAAGTHPDPNPKNNFNSNGFPEALGAPLDGLLVVDEAPGYIIKQNNVDLFEQNGPVYPICTRFGSFTIPIYISSKTGNFAADGTPLFDTNIVTYHVSCIAYTGCLICRKSNVPPVFPNLTIQTTPSTSRRIILKNVENTLAHKVSSHAQIPRASNYQLRELLSRAQLYESLPKPQILARAAQHAQVVQFHDS